MTGVQTCALPICQITPFGKRLFIYFLHFRNLLPGFHKHKVHASEPGQPFPIVLQKYRKIKRTIRSKYKILRKTAIDCLRQNIFVSLKPPFIRFRISRWRITSIKRFFNHQEHETYHPAFRRGLFDNTVNICHNSPII